MVAESHSQNFILNEQNFCELFMVLLQDEFRIRAISSLFGCRLFVSGLVVHHVIDTFLVLRCVEGRCSA